MSELETKLERIRGLLAEHNLDGLLLQDVANFAWATCGAASYVNTATHAGVGSLLITPQERYLITDRIEAPRFEQEEKLKAQGWTFVVDDWFDGGSFAELLIGLSLGTDGLYAEGKNLGEDVVKLRMQLLPEEQERFREVSRRSAAAMSAAVAQVRPGMTEYEIAAVLDAETYQRRVQPIVNLIATDERIFQFRHPLPTAKVMDKYAMLVLCGRRAGVVTSLTRLVHFGPLPDEIRRKADAAAYVDAALIGATRDGAHERAVFETGVSAYARQGFADEWQLHHQGGPAGYNPREWVATPSSTHVIGAGETYAWNPSITGTKSEDTILVTEDVPEILTVMEDWPTIPVEVNGLIIERPDILVIE